MFSVWAVVAPKILKVKTYRGYPSNRQEELELDKSDVDTMRMDTVGKPTWWNHTSKDIVGTIGADKVVDDAWHMRLDLSPETAQGEAVIRHVKAGRLHGVSVGHRIVNGVPELDEVSICVKGARDGSRVYFDDETRLYKSEGDPTYSIAAASASSDTPEEGSLVVLELTIQASDSIAGGAASPNTVQSDPPATMEQPPAPAASPPPAATPPAATPAQPAAPPADAPMTDKIEDVIDAVTFPATSGIRQMLDSGAPDGVLAKVVELETSKFEVEKKLEDMQKAMQAQQERHEREKEADARIMSEYAAVAGIPISQPAPVDVPPAAPIAEARAQYSEAARIARIWKEKRNQTSNQVPEAMSREIKAASQYNDNLSYGPGSKDWGQPKRVVPRTCIIQASTSKHIGLHGGTPVDNRHETPSTHDILTREGALQEAEPGMGLNFNHRHLQTAEQAALWGSGPRTTEQFHSINMQPMMQQFNSYMMESKAEQHESIDRAYWETQKPRMDSFRHHGSLY